MATPGLVDNMVYDMIPTVPSASGITTVNASLYEVDCRAIPHASVRFGPLGPSENTMSFDFGGGDNHSFSLALPCAYPPSLLFAG